MDDSYQLLDQNYDPLAGGTALDEAGDNGPLAGGSVLDEARDDGETETIQIIGDPEAQAPEPAEGLLEVRDAKQKIEDLLQAMRPQREVLLGIIGFCRQPRLAEDVDQRIAELTQHIYMVYDGVELRRLLQESEGLEYLEPEQPPDAKALTDIGEDGVEYLVIQRREAGHWLSTAAAIEVLEADDPESDFWALLGSEPQYQSVYQEILEFCRDSRSIKELDAAFNNHPLLAEPRRYSGYFVERLEKCSALSWQGGWLTSDIGLAMLTKKPGE